MWFKAFLITVCLILSTAVSAQETADTAAENAEMLMLSTEAEKTDITTSGGDDYTEPTSSAEMQETETTAESKQIPIASNVSIQFTDSDLEKQMANATLDDIEKLKQQNFDFNTKDSTGNPALYYLLTRNPNLEVVKKALEYGADVNMSAANGMIPLNIATSKANELQLQIMMMKTMGLDVSNPEIQDKLKENLFLEMSRMNELTQMLIEAGADVDRVSSLGTPLMNAATNAWNAEIAQRLIDAGADVNKTDKNGRTALFYAASGGNDDIVVLLLKAGANPNIKDKDGKIYSDVERIEVGEVL